jgi:signal recognition particle receptor subunit beta
MVQINFAQKQVSAKIVYYGPGMSGKTTNLEVIHQRAPEQNKGELTSISTDGDRTLFFDFMPLDLGTVAGMKTSFQIYTVPGQVYYNSTRKLVLQGVDGVVFVADSSAANMQENLESLRNLEENLNEYGKSLATLPHVIQLNKRDLPDALGAEELAQLLNVHGAPCFEAIANTGQGVFPTLKALAARVLETIHANSASGGRGAPAAPRAPSGVAPLPPPSPAFAAQPPAPLPQAAPKVAPQPVQQPAAMSMAAAAPARVQPTPSRPQVVGLGQTGMRPAPQAAQPMAPAAPVPMQPHAQPLAHAPQPLSGTGIRPGFQQHAAAGATPTQYAAQQAQYGLQQAPVPLPQNHNPMGAMGAQQTAPAPHPGYAPVQQPAYEAVEQAPQAYAAPQQQQQYAPQAPAPAPNLQMAGRASNVDAASRAPKNLRTGAVPSPVSGTRFHPRNAAASTASTPRAEPRPTLARPSSNKLFLGVFVIAGLILAAGLAYVAMSFL